MKKITLWLIFINLLFMPLSLLLGQGQEITWRLTDITNLARSTATVCYRYDLNSDIALGGSISLQTSSVLPSIIQVNKKDFYIGFGVDAFYYLSYPKLKNYQRITYVNSEIAYGHMSFLRFDDYFVREAKKRFYQYAAATKNEIRFSIKLGLQKNYYKGFIIEWFAGIGIKYKNVQYQDDLYKKAETLSDMGLLKSIFNNFTNFDGLDRTEGKRFRLIIPLGMKIGYAF